MSDAKKEEKDYLTTHKKTAETRTRLSFKLGTVFDISQTNAQPADYPTLFPNRKIAFTYAGDELKNLKALLLAYANQQGIHVKTAKIVNSAAKGYYQSATHAIVLSDRNNESETIHMLIHELVHAALHNQEKMSQKEPTLQGTPVLEYQAEMRAYLVAHAFGLDTKAHSLQYTAQWTKNLENVAELEKALEEVRMASNGIISSLETLLEKERLNTHENTKNTLETKNSALPNALFSIRTIEPIAKIGAHTVYDLELHAESTEPQVYRILTTKSPDEIGETWTGKKSGPEWEKENKLTHFLTKHPDLASRLEKIANIEKVLPGGPELLETYVAKERTKDRNSGLSL